MTLNFPEYALKCLKIIESSSFEAYFVGGCVRDGILGRPCNDIDITTNALPEEIMSLFGHTVPTGIKHGTVTVIIDGRSIEVTTYRTEGKYEDSRHPSSVNFVKDIKYDLSRRDFTVNALAYNPKIGLVDLFGGLDDISKRQIRTVGDPEMRFSEDALRILRAFRFSGVLGFEIDSSTLKAANTLSQLINNISGERVLDELTKLSLGGDPSVIAEFINGSALSGFGISGLKHNKSTLKALAGCPAGRDMKTALFFSLFVHDTELLKEKLKPNNRLYRFISFLDSAEQYAVPKNKAELKQLMYRQGDELVRLYIYYIKLRDSLQSSRLTDMLCETMEKREPYRVSDLEINGKDLKQLGFSGNEIGTILDRAVQHIIEFPEDNSRDRLIKLIKN